MGTTASASTAVSVTENANNLPQLTVSMDKPQDHDKESMHSWSIFEFDMEKMEKSRWWRAGAAGSIAGLCEHTLLYPIDTIKTRMQAVLISDTQIQYKSFIDCFTQVCS